MKKRLVAIAITITTTNSVASIEAPDLSDSISNIATILGAMVSFLALVFASKKVLYFAEGSQFAIGQSKKREKREREKKAEREKREKKITNNFLKTSMSKTEKKRREKLYEIKQARKERKIKGKYKAKGGDKFRTKTGRVLTPAQQYRLKNDKIMSKKYREVFGEGEFKNKGSKIKTQKSSNSSRTKYKTKSHTTHPKKYRNS